jgi:hypothetical protein
MVWGRDQKTVYASVPTGTDEATTDIWKWNLDGSNPEKFAHRCGVVSDAHPGGQYLVAAELFGEITGIYEVFISASVSWPVNVTMLHRTEELPDGILAHDRYYFSFFGLRDSSSALIC